MKILIIDDEDDIRRIARLALSKIGKMEVIDANNGPEGVRKAEEEMPDVILLDVMMPGVDGPSTLTQLRNNSATAEIPVIFMTAKAMNSELERLRGMDVAGVLVKPFDVMTLASQVRSVLEGK
jgi:two-component system, OmpR family, response regulator